METKHKFKIAGLGEVLWDKLPNKDVLGGAPANVAYHLSQLGEDGYIISAVGNDKLGDDIISILSEKNVNLIINKPDYPTGTVIVTIDKDGVPNFVITKDVAWDYIELNDESKKLAGQLDAICFGSLAQRNETSKETIIDFIKLVPDGSLKIFDINIRQQFYDKKTIADSLELANILKINDDELPIVAELFHWEGGQETLCNKLIETYNLNMVAYTCGASGSYLYSKGESSYLETPKVDVKDTVGAGDSFTAGLIYTLLNNYPLKKCHKFAVELAAFVCQNDGAMPEYDKKRFNEILSNE